MTQALASPTTMLAKFMAPVAEKTGLSPEDASRVVTTNVGAGILQGISKIVLSPIGEKLLVELGLGTVSTLASIYLAKDKDTSKDLFLFGVRLLSDLPNLDVAQQEVLRRQAVELLDALRSRDLRRMITVLRAQSYGGVEEITAPPIPRQVVYQPQEEEEKTVKPHSAIQLAL